MVVTPTQHEGRQLKLAILDSLEKSRSDYIKQARTFAIRYAKAHGKVSINDVRRDCPPPPGVHPSALGAVLRGEMWHPIGYTEAKHPSAHARVIRVYEWRGA